MAGEEWAKRIVPEALNRPVEVHDNGKAQVCTTCVLGLIMRLKWHWNGHNCVAIDQHA